MTMCLIGSQLLDGICVTLSSRLHFLPVCVHHFLPHFVSSTQCFMDMLGYSTLQTALWLGLHMEGINRLLNKFQVNSPYNCVGHSISSLPAFQILKISLVLFNVIIF
ncbi:hypothetical protein ILYODFUR_008757 [Ilyodon furcidens]|uniref:Uncharacterized protein n=1 Tax=Ilyodon furcidens TaxID=33524 RepID=A0ABV0US08_9TELE